jgi:hypothetical protein
MNPEEHAAHMAKVEEGLNAIMQSEDINEIKQIAQSLLSEEQQEQASEPVVKPSFQDKLAQASGVGQEAQ